MQTVVSQYVFLFPWQYIGSQEDSKKRQFQSFLWPTSGLFAFAMRRRGVAL